MVPGAAGGIFCSVHSMISRVRGNPVAVLHACLSSDPDALEKQALANVRLTKGARIAAGAYFHCVVGVGVKWS
jgi:hypothetical protein